MDEGLGRTESAASAAQWLLPQRPDASVPARAETVCARVIAFWTR
jgi:hypothetical protein